MIEQILVALDESAPSYAALQSAADLAAERSGVLVGIFVEDIDLFAAASLPGSKIVSSHAGTVSPIDPDVLTRSLRVRARRLEGALARIAAAHRVAWRFETPRGRVGEEILHAGAQSEMIAIGISASQHLSGAVGSNTRLVIESARCAVLVARRALTRAQRIVVLFSGEGRAREIGKSLARLTGAAISLHETPENQQAALDLLMRQSATYVVIDRASIVRLQIGAYALAEKLKLEGLLVTD